MKFIAKFLTDTVFLLKEMQTIQSHGLIQAVHSNGSFKRFNQAVKSVELESSLNRLLSMTFFLH